MSPTAVAGGPRSNEEKKQEKEKGRERENDGATARGEGGRCLQDEEKAVVVADREGRWRRWRTRMEEK